MWDATYQQSIIADLEALIGDRILKKGAYFTDIHFGKKSNSEVHNQDCVDFIDFFCDEVKKQGDIDHICFLGDWHENRSSLNLSTLNYSYKGLSKLNSLGLPIFLIVGNHDLYHKTTREVHSLPQFKEFENVLVIEHPVLVNQIFGKAVFAPYIFEDEYEFMASSENEYQQAQTWLGHFEFQGFCVTGGNVIMKTGPSIEHFTGPTRIFSGHFHKRQHYKNVFYIGNTFPMDFGDAGDNARGMAVYDYESDDLQFINWDDCPKFLKIKLTDLLDDDSAVLPKMRLKCLCDAVISFEENIAIRDTFIKRYQLRDFIFDEETDLNESIKESNADINWGGGDDETIDGAVIKMIQSIENDKIDNNLLVECYSNLPKDL